MILFKSIIIERIIFIILWVCDSMILFKYSINVRYWIDVLIVKSKYIIFVMNIQKKKKKIQHITIALTSCPHSTCPALRLTSDTPTSEKQHAFCPQVQTLLCDLQLLVWFSGPNRFPNGQDQFERN